MGKRGFKPAWEFCYICGDFLTNTERYRKVGSWGRGYCSNCYGMYFSDSCRFDAFGKLKCYICKKYLTIENFIKDDYQTHGFRTKCKKCDYKKSREYLKNNPEKVKEYRNRHRKARLKLKKSQAERERENLDDNYIRRLLARYSHRAESEFTEKEIDAKRKLILSQRENGGREYLQCEMEVRKILEKIFPGFKFPSKNPKWNKSEKSGYPMQIDCYNKKLGLAVEYNGKQHYEHVEFFQDEESHEAQKLRDIEKRNNCEKELIDLIIVPYWITEYKKFLMDELRKLAI